MPDTQSIAATNMFDLMGQLSLIGQNVTNANTPAYKGVTSFEQALDLEQSTTADTVQSVSFQKVDLSQGSLNPTGKPLDLALSGPGFFVVENKGHLYLSRLGQLGINAKGVLSDSHGSAVMGLQGSIFLDSPDVTIHPNGTITQGDAEIDQLQIVQIEDSRSLSISENGYFIYPDKLEESNSQTQILQGFIESSNVDVASETIKMIEMMRRFEMQQKILRANDAMINNGITILGEF